MPKIKDSRKMKNPLGLRALNSKFFLPVLKLETERRRSVELPKTSRCIEMTTEREETPQELDYLRHKLHQYKEQHAILLDAYNRNVVIADQKVEEKKLMTHQAKLLGDKIEFCRAQVDEGYALVKGDQNAFHMLEELIEHNTMHHPTMKSAIEKAQNEIAELQQKAKQKKRELHAIEKERERLLAEQEATGFASLPLNPPQRASRRHALQTCPKVRSFAIRHIWEDEFANMLEHAYNEIAEKKNLVAEQKKELEALSKMVSPEVLNAKLAKAERRYKKMKSHVDSLAGSRPKEPTLESSSLHEKDADLITNICRTLRDVFSEPRQHTMKRINRYRNNRRVLVNAFSPMWDSVIKHLIPAVSTLCGDDMRGYKRHVSRIARERQKLVRSKIKMCGRITRLVARRKKCLAHDMWNMRVEEDDLKSSVHKLETKTVDIGKLLRDASSFGDRAYLATVHRFLDEQREVLANSILANENDEAMLQHAFPFDDPETHEDFYRALVSTLKRRNAENVALIEQISRGQHGEAPSPRKKTQTDSKAAGKFTANLDGIPYTRNVSVGNTTISGSQTDHDENFMTEHVIYNDKVTFGELHGEATVSILAEKHMSMRVVFEMLDMPLFIYTPVDFIALPPAPQLEIAAEPPNGMSEVERTWWKMGYALVQLLEVDYEKAWPRFYLRGINELTAPNRSDLVLRAGELPLESLGTLVWCATVYKPDVLCELPPLPGLGALTSTTHAVSFVNVNLYERPRTHFARHYYHVQFYDVTSGWTQWLTMEYRFILYFLDLPMDERLETSVDPNKLQTLIEFVFSSDFDFEYPSSAGLRREPFVSVREVLDANEPLCDTWTVADLVDSGAQDESDDDDFGWAEDEPDISIELIFTGEALTCSFFAGHELPERIRTTHVTRRNR